MEEEEEEMVVVVATAAKLTLASFPSLSSQFSEWKVRRGGGGAGRYSEGASLSLSLLSSLSSASDNADPRPTFVHTHTRSPPIPRAGDVGRKRTDQWCQVAFEMTGGTLIGTFQNSICIRTTHKWENDCSIQCGNMYCVHI